MRAFGNRYVWWQRPPILVRLEPWWRWSVWLAVAIVASYMADRCGSGNTWQEWPPRLDHLTFTA